MFDYDDFDDEDFSSVVTFTFNDHTPSTSRSATATVRGEQSYPEIVQQFVYFLNAMGYTYIAGLAVLDQNGKEMHVTDL